MINLKNLISLILTVFLSSKLQIVNYFVNTKKNIITSYV